MGRGGAPVSPGALTIPETAEYLGISRASVYRLVKAGKLRPKRFGRSLRIAKIELDRFLESDAEELPSR